MLSGWMQKNEGPHSKRRKRGKLLNSEKEGEKGKEEAGHEYNWQKAGSIVLSK